MITFSCGWLLAPGMKPDNGRASQRRAIQVFLCLGVLTVGGLQCVYSSPLIHSDNRILFQLLKYIHSSATEPHEIQLSRPIISPHRWISFFFPFFLSFLGIIALYRGKKVNPRVKRRENFSNQTSMNLLAIRNAWRK